MQNLNRSRHGGKRRTIRMNYEEAIEYIHGIYWRGSKLGLSRTEELLGLL